jgi:hypothetical protein
METWAGFLRPKETPMKLIVTQEWGPYKKGDQITDATTISEVLASCSAANVVSVEVIGEQQPANAYHGDTAPPAATL